MRVAAIDCGTNSIRLLVTDIETDGDAARSRDVDRRLEIVRLGYRVDETGRLAPEALARTFDACKRYADRIAELGAERVRFVATSATRDADNQDEFMAGVRETLGVTPDVVSGAAEAQLSFEGATHDLTADGPVLAVDIGGGSTEFVVGEPGDSEPAAVSVDLGSVRLTERLLPSDPPTNAEIAEARSEVSQRLDEAAAAVSLDEARTFVGLAGTVTTLAAMALDLPEYDSTRIHRAVIPANDMHRTTERLHTMTVAERRALPFMHPGRADVIGGGALILDELLRRISDKLAKPAVLVSEHDILDGIAWSIVR